jgi:energy-converting hydrogenase Eha subunit A
MLIVLAAAAIFDITQPQSKLSQWLLGLAAALFITVSALEIVIWRRHGPSRPRRFPQTRSELVPVAVVALDILAISFRVGATNFEATLAVVALTMAWLCFMKSLRAHQLDF